MALEKPRLLREVSLEVAASEAAMTSSRIAT